MITRSRSWKAVGLVVAVTWGALACRAIAGIEDIPDLPGTDGGHPEAGADVGHHDAKGDSQTSHDAKGDSHESNDAGHDSGAHDSGVDAPVRSPLFFAWVTAVDAGAPDGAPQPPAPDAGSVAYVQPFVVYPLEPGSVPTAVGCPFVIHTLASGLNPAAPPDFVPETLATLAASRGNPGAFAYVSGPPSDTQSGLTLVTGETRCGQETTLASPFAGEFVVHAVFGGDGQRLAYYQTIVDGGSYTGLELRVVGSNGTGDTHYRTFPVVIGDAAPPMAAVGWDPTAGDFGWVETNSANAPFIVEGPTATSFCGPDAAAGLPGLPVVEIAFGNNGQHYFALVESFLSADYAYTTWLEHTNCSPGRPFPRPGNYGDFALSPDGGAYALIVGPPAGADGGPLSDAGTASALWLATTSPVGGAFTMHLCDSPPAGQSLATPEWVDRTHVAWTQAPVLDSGVATRSWIDLGQGPYILPVTLMIAELADGGGCTNVHPVELPQTHAAGATAYIPSPSTPLTNEILQFVSTGFSCAVSAVGSGYGVIGWLTLLGTAASFAWRRRRRRKV